MTTTQDILVIGLGEMQVSKDPSTILTCLGLGSCIGFSVYDPIVKVGGMVHIVLPSSDGRETNAPAKFADMAIPSLLDAMSDLGSTNRSLVVKMAGGAQMSLAKGGSGIFKTGERNIESVNAIAKMHGLKIAASDVGGHSGRTLRLFVSSGQVTVTTAGTQTQDL